LAHHGKGAFVDGAEGQPGSGLHGSLSALARSSRPPILFVDNLEDVIGDCDVDG
jgi:hypothetical protein